MTEVMHTAGNLLLVGGGDDNVLAAYSVRPPSTLGAFDFDEHRGWASDGEEFTDPALWRARVVALAHAASATVD